MLKFLFILLILNSSGCDSITQGNFHPGFDPESIYFFSDTFDRSDEPLSSSDQWRVGVLGESTLDLVSGEVIVSTSSGLPNFAYHIERINQNSVQVTAEFKILGSSFGSDPNGILIVLLHSQSTEDIANLYGCGFETGSGALRVVRVEEDFPTVLTASSANVSFENGHIYKIQFTRTGNALSCTVSGDADISIDAIDSTFDNGFAGFAGGKENVPELSVREFRILKE